MPPDATLMGLMRDSVTAPRETATQLLGLDLPRSVLLEGTALLAVVNGLLAVLVGGIAMPMQDGSEMVINPILWTLILFAGIILSASALQVAGRILGGIGSFEGALLVTVWINSLGLAIELATILLGFLSVDVASVFFLLGLVVLLWALVNFVRVLHGFDGILRSFLAIVLAGFGTLVGLSFLLTLALSLGAPANV